MSGESQTRSAVLVAVIAAAVIIAYQVAAKATRDALFLHNFRIVYLPAIKIASALFSTLLLLPALRIMTRAGPARLVPAAFWLSGMLHLGEWALYFHSRNAVAVVLYLHFAGFGAILISGFWSMVNERFDPHTAKKKMANIAAGGSIGALVGGLTGAFLTKPLVMLPILAAMHLFCAWLLRNLTSPRAQTSIIPGVNRSGISVLARLPYLRQLALLVFLGASGSVLIEYVFSARVKERFLDPADLQLFFALFHTAANLAGFLIHMAVTRLVLEKLGLGVAARALPATVAVGSIGALLWPGLGGLTAARGSELVMRNSLFRSAYELFYTAVPPTEKRSAKQIIDVGFERLGDIAGAALCGLLLFLLTPDRAGPAVMAAACMTGLAGMLVSLRLGRGYVLALERSLRNRAVELNLQDVTDQTTRATLTRTIARVSPGQKAPKHEESESDRADPMLRRIGDLRSGDAVRVLRVLMDPLDPALAGHVIPLLAWDDVAGDAMRALGRAGPAITGQLIDALLDGSQSFAIRRRLPRVLAMYPSPRTVEGLLLGLNDKRFEVRFRCGRALLQMSGPGSGLSFPGEPILRAVSRELELGRHLWESHRLLDGYEEDELVGDRANRGLEHVFTLLALILPAGPLRIAFRALHCGDDILRGTALEYLESIVPQSLREQLWPYLEDGRPVRPSTRSREEILADLLQSHESIQARLEQLKARRAGTA